VLHGEIEAQPYNMVRISQSSHEDRMLISTLRNLLAYFFRSNIFCVEGCQPLVNSLIANGRHIGCILSLGPSNFEVTFPHIPIVGSIGYILGGLGLQTLIYLDDKTITNKGC
jgi:hypothetical protein